MNKNESSQQQTSILASARGNKGCVAVLLTGVKNVSCISGPKANRRALGY